MIRSAEAVPAHDWKRVPAGFRVKHAGYAGGSPNTTPHRTTRSGLGDVLRIGAAALFWRIRDARHTKPSRRERVLRLAL